MIIEQIEDMCRTNLDRGYAPQLKAVLNLIEDGKKTGRIYLELDGESARLVYRRLISHNCQECMVADDECRAEDSCTQIARILRSQAPAVFGR